MGCAAVKARTRPVPGNHDWARGTENLIGYHGYFGANATDAGGKSYYSYDIAGSNWHVVNLDSECAARARRLRRRLGAGAVAQGRPRRQQHARTSSPCGTSRATARAPRLTDAPAAVGRPLRGRRRPPARRARPHLRALRADESGATLAGRRSPTRRTASGSSRSAPAARPPRPRHAAADEPGAQRHDVRHHEAHAPCHSYDWAFLPIAGSTFTDSGTGPSTGRRRTRPTDCHDDRRLPRPRSRRRVAGGTRTPRRRHRCRQRPADRGAHRRTPLTARPPLTPTALHVDIHDNRQQRSRQDYTIRAPTTAPPAPISVTVSLTVSTPPMNGPQLNGSSQYVTFGAAPA